MNPVREGIDAAQTAREGDLIDGLSIKAMQLHSLMVALMHAIRNDDMPTVHIENTCWLACDLVERIGLDVEALTRLRNFKAGRVL